MLVHGPESSPEKTFGYWRQQYNRTDASERIESRRKVYDLVLDEVIFDPDVEFAVILWRLGLWNQGIHINMGSGRPWAEQQMRVQAHMGSLVCVEPFIDQIHYNKHTSNKTRNGIPDLLRAVGEQGIRDYLTALKAGEVNDTDTGIDVVSAVSHASPFSDRSAKVVRFSYSLGSMHPDIQKLALKEGVRLLDQSGILVVEAPGFTNKNGLHIKEHKVAKRLSRNTGRKYAPPIPPNAAGVAEWLYLLLTNECEFVYAYDHRSAAYMKNPYSVGVILNSMRSMSDGYLDENGRPPNIEEFDNALRQEMGPEVLLAKLGFRRKITDTHRVEIVAGQRQLNLPSKYVRITDEMAKQIYQETFGS